MTYTVMHTRLSYAVVMGEDGSFKRVANCGYRVGQSVQNIIESHSADFLSSDHPHERRISMKRSKKVLIFVFLLLILALIATATVSGIMVYQKRVHRDSAFISDTAAASKVVTDTEGNKVALVYVESEEIPAGILDVYTDTDGNEYRYDESGALYDYRPANESTTADTSSAVMANSVAEDNTSMNMDKALQLAEQYAADFCGEDFDNFELVIQQHDETLDDYFFEYRVIYPGGIIGELCLITLEPNGDLRQITRPYENMLADFDPAILETVDQADFKAAVKASANAQYPDHDVSYTIDRVYVSEQDGKLGLLAVLVVTLDSEPGTTGTEVFYPFES